MSEVFQWMVAAGVGAAVGVSIIRVPLELLTKQIQAGLTARYRRARCVGGGVRVVCTSDRCSRVAHDPKGDSVRCPNLPRCTGDSEPVGLCGPHQDDGRGIPRVWAVGLCKPQDAAVVVHPAWTMFECCMAVAWTSRGGGGGAGA